MHLIYEYDMIKKSLIGPLTQLVRVVGIGSTIRYAGVAELADALDLGSSALRLAGSTPVTRTIGKSVRTIRIFDIFSLKYD